MQLRALYADAAPATPARNPSASAPSNSGTSASTTAAANTSAPRRLAALREIDLTDSARVSSRLVLHLEKLQRTAPGLEVLRMNGVGGLFGE